MHTGAHRFFASAKRARTSPKPAAAASSLQQYLLSRAIGSLGATLIGGSAIAAALLGFGPEAAGTPAPFVHLPADTGVEPGAASQADPELVAAVLAPPDETLSKRPPGTLAEPPAPEPKVHKVSIDRGDTLMAVMTRAGADRREAHEAIAALGTLYDPRRLMPGQELTFSFLPDEEGTPQLKDLSLSASVERDVVVRREEGGGFVAEEVEKPLAEVVHRAEGTIDDSLYLAARRAGLPMPVLVELIRIYSYDVDFQREIQPGDSFAVLYQSFQDEADQPVKHGEVLHARLTVGGTDLSLWRYELEDGTVDYFNEKGESARKALLKTPVDGARLSSGFGLRRHPILGYNRMHKGVDFAAPRGTPVVAAGDGVIEVAGSNGGYGKYIRIRHNNTYKTAYAHLHRFARGIGRGKRVRQGQVIAYVGSTGRSTGPHLHYEVLQGSRQINPMGLKLPTGRTLKGAALQRFVAHRDELATQMARAPLVTRVARQDD